MRRDSPSHVQLGRRNVHQHGGLVQVRLHPAVLGRRRHRIDAVDGARRGHQLRRSVRHSTIGAAVCTLAPCPTTLSTAVCSWCWPSTAATATTVATALATVITTAALSAGAITTAALPPSLAPVDAVAAVALTTAALATALAAAALAAAALAAAALAVASAAHPSAAVALHIDHY